MGSAHLSVPNASPFFLSSAPALLARGGGFFLLAVLLLLGGGLLGVASRLALDAEQAGLRAFAAHQRVRPVRLLAGDGVPLQTGLLRVDERRDGRRQDATTRSERFFFYVKKNPGKKNVFRRANRSSSSSARGSVRTQRYTLISLDDHIPG